MFVSGDNIFDRGLFLNFEGCEIIQKAKIEEAPQPCNGLQRETLRALSRLSF